MPTPSVTHTTFAIERRYPHPPTRVFAAFSDPVKKRRWMGGDADGFSIESFDMTFEVGSRERWTFRFNVGELITNETRYQDIVPNQRIVFVYTMDFGDTRASSSQTTIELIPDGTGTKLLFTEQGAFFDGIDQAAGREEGTRGLLEALAAELEQYA